MGWNHQVPIDCFENNLGHHENVLRKIQIWIIPTNGVKTEKMMKIVPNGEFGHNFLEQVFHDNTPNTSQEDSELRF